MSAQDDRKDELLKTPPAEARTTPLGSSDPHATIDLPQAIDFTEARLAEVAARYELEAELGRGGMGIVYRARDKETNECVALKVLKPEIASEQALLDRFKNELKLARKITHKRVCRTYELLRFGDTVVIAMEYVEGESLRAVLDRFGGLPLRKGIAVAQQVCSALGEAHVQGIVHRDLKPENLMLDRAGNVKVMDFGIARSVETSATTTGGVIGTPAYMAPEQAEGKAVDARTDIYSLGLILYEVFTSAAAFRADTPLALAMKQIRETPPAPREVEPTLPAHIEKAIVKCLEKNPAKRFQSVEEFERALGREAEAEVTPAAAGEDVPLPVHLAYWQRADWMLVAGAALAVVLSFALYDRVLPFGALAVSFSRDNAIERAKELTAKYAPEAKPDEFEAFDIGLFQLLLFPEAVMGRGLEAPLEYFRSRSGPFWAIQGRASRRGVSWVDLDGEGRVLSLQVAREELPGGAAAGPATVQEALPMARQYAEEIFHAPVAGLEPTPYAYVAEQHRWLAAGRGTRLQFSKGTPVEWMLPDGKTAVVVEMKGGRLLRASQGPVRAGNPFWSGETQVMQTNWGRATKRGIQLLALIIPVPFALFVLRRMWRGSFRQPWLPTAIIVLTVAGAVYLVPGEERTATWWVIYLAGLVPALLCWYAMLCVPQYYAGKVLPAHLRTFSDLLRQGLKAQPAGLAVMRGALLGASYLGLHLVLLLLLGRFQWGSTSTGVFEVLSEVASVSGERLVPLMGLLGFSLAIAITWMLVALPLALLRRTTARRPVLLLGLALFWSLTAFSLPGAGGYPLLPLYLFAGLQGVCFAWVFLRYDLLTCLSATFTVMAWLFCFPLLRIFGGVEFWSYVWVMVPWLLFTLLGAVLWFRPELVAWRRRTAAVFE